MRLSETAVRLAFAALLLLASGHAAAQTLIDIANDATDPSNLDDSEPSIAVNPANPLEISVLAFSGRWNNTVMAPVWKSRDGGVTWSRIAQIALPSVGGIGPSDQKIAYGADGRLFLSELSAYTGPPTCFIARQAGAADAPLAGGAIFAVDQPLVTSDNSGGAFANRRYVAWAYVPPDSDRSIATENDRSMVSFSTDDGVEVTDVGAGDNRAYPNRTTRIAVAPDGRVFIIYKTREGAVDANFENAHFRVQRSDDGGATWSALGPSGVSVHGAPQVQTWFTTNWGNSKNGGKVARARSSDGWIAVHPVSGDVWAVYCNRDASGFGQIFAVRSTDGGATWSAPSRITDGTHNSAYPEIAVASNGTAGVLYADYDDSGARTLYRHHFARSFDNGATWTSTLLQSFATQDVFNAHNQFLWGDYEGLTALGETFYGVFTGQSIGRAIVQLDPIFFRMAATPTTRE